jgi:hypothetical protein
MLASLDAQTSGPVNTVLEGDIVNAATSAPVTLARARLDQGQNDPLYAKADSQGHFAFENLAPGNYSLTVEGPGFFQTCTQVTIGVQALPTGRGKVSTNTGAVLASKSLDVAFSQSTGADGTAHVVAKVPVLPYAAITGKVTDPRGLPMMNCTVVVFIGRPVEPGHIRKWPPPVTNGTFDIVRYASAQTDERGEYRIGPLEPGTYWVVADRDGLGWPGWESVDRATWFPAATSRDAARPLELAAGQLARADIGIVRRTGVSVAGRLTMPPGAADSTSSAPEGATHLYTSLALQPPRNASMNPNGPFTSTRKDEFEFSDVVPGKYTLWALTRDASTDLYPANQKPLYGFVREIEVGERDVTGLDVALQPLRDLPGAVTFADGCSPVPLTIRAVNHGPIAAVQVTAATGPDGRFVLSGLTSGQFGIYVSWPPSAAPRTGVASIHLGSRDVLKEGLDMPYSGDENLQIAMQCAAGGGSP